MKSPEQIQEARKIVRNRLTEVVTEDQKLLLTGMLNALVWCCDGKASNAMEMVLNNVPFSSIGEVER